MTRSLQLNRPSRPFLLPISRASPFDVLQECQTGDCFPEQDGSVIVRDDLDALLQVLPEDIRDLVASHPQRAVLLEVVLDLGRRPEARC